MIACELADSLELDTTNPKKPNPVHPVHRCESKNMDGKHKQAGTPLRRRLTGSMISRIHWMPGALTTLLGLPYTDSFGSARQRLL